MSSQLIGQVMQLIAIVVFVYATASTFLQPFLDEKSFLQALFLPRCFFYIAPPVLLFGVIGSGILYVKPAQKK